MAEVRAVLDTNIVVAAHRSSGAMSPNREILARWRAGEFTLLYSEDVLLEYVEKLIELGLSDEKLQRFVSSLAGLGEAARSLSFISAATLRTRTTSRSCSAPSMAMPPIWSLTTPAFPRSRRIARSRICEPLPFLNELRTAPAGSP